jgi:DNA-binding IclR family transcriptional regulator
MASAAQPQDDRKSGDRRSNSTVGRVVAVLRVLRQASAPLALSTIAREVGIAPSSAHSILLQLLQHDVVTQDADKRYELGPSILYLGSAYARGSRIYRSIWLELVTAANELEVTTALAVPWADHHLILNAHRGGPSHVAIPFGGLVPLDGGSWGKVYYGWSGADIPQTLTAYTDASVVEPEQFAEELDAARRRGYATDRSEYAAGIGGVSAPITSHLGYEGLASFVAPLARIDDISFDTLGSRVAELAARASLNLGDRERVRNFGFE